MRQPEPTKELGPFNLAVLLQGRFPSFFAGKPVPAPGPPGRPKEQEQRPAGNGVRLLPHEDGLGWRIFDIIDGKRHSIDDVQTGQDRQRNEQ